MHWLSALAAVFSFAKELLKYMRQREQCSREAVHEMRGMTKALKKARKNGDTSEIEESFSKLGIFGGGKLPDEVTTLQPKNIQDS